MKLSRDDNITIAKQVKSIVYFLLEKDEVVYVGQSKTGLERPYSHRDKSFDSVAYIECKEEDLDKLESFYIRKYRPQYNKTSTLYDYSFARIKKIIREMHGYSQFTVNDLKKIIKNLKIETYALNGLVYVSEEDFKIILNFLKTN